MIRPRYQSRLNALIVGVRPSMTHNNGVRNVMLADNLAHSGKIAWSTGLQMLKDDLCAESHLSGGEVWLSDWTIREADREASRWSDASSTLELLSVSLGPLAHEADILRGPQFWAQWCRNVDALMLAIEGESSRFSLDTPELAEHCLELVSQHGGPTSLNEMLEFFAANNGGDAPEEVVFRPLCSVVERLQLTALIESSLSAEQVCTANQDVLLGQRAGPTPPSLTASCQRRSTSGRPRPRRSRLGDRRNLR